MTRAAPWPRARHQGMCVTNAVCRYGLSGSDVRVRCQAGGVTHPSHTLQVLCEKASLSPCVVCAAAGAGPAEGVGVPARPERLLHPDLHCPGLAPRPARSR